MDMIGDFLIGAPTISAILAKLDSEDRSAWLVCDIRNEDLAKRLFPALNVIGVNLRSFVFNPAYRIQMIREIASLKASGVLNLCLSRDLLWGDSIARTSGARRRSAFKGYADRSGRLALQLSERWYTDVTPITVPGAFEHYNLVDGCAALGFLTPPVPFPQQRERFPQAHPLPLAPYFVVAPGSLQARKLWPGEKFAELADRIHRHTGWQCVLLGAPGDIVAAECVASAMRLKAENLAGKTSLAQAAGIIANGRLLIGNDSSLVHFAATLGTPSVVALGGAHPGRFLPYPPDAPWPARPEAANHPMPCYGCDWNCPFVRNDQPSPCIEKIAVEDMWEAALRAIDSSGRSINEQ